jgi:hypothetical protein
MNNEDDEFILEKDAYIRYPHLLGDKELRQARKNHLIAFYRAKRSFAYKLGDIKKYIEQKRVEPCPASAPQIGEVPTVTEAASNFAASGSIRSLEGLTGTVFGTTASVAECAVARLEHAIWTKPKSDSLKSS